ncbi:hypothetical protein SSTU70S_05415 [Stutzerimonas stutzeri]
MSAEWQPNLVALQTIVQREIPPLHAHLAGRRMLPAITMVLYFSFIFGSLIGARIGEMDVLQLHGLHRAGADHDVGDHQLVQQRGLELLQHQVPAFHRASCRSRRFRRR